MYVFVEAKQGGRLHGDLENAGSPFKKMMLIHLPRVETRVYTCCKLLYNPHVLLENNSPLRRSQELHHVTEEVGLRELHQPGRQPIERTDGAGAAAVLLAAPFSCKLLPRHLVVARRA